MKIYRPNGRCNICGEQLRKIRLQKNLSQEKLAARLQIAGLNFSQKSISRIESGKRLVADYELNYLAEALGITICCLLGMEDEKPSR